VPPRGWSGLAIINTFEQKLGTRFSGAGPRQLFRKLTLIMFYEASAIACARQVRPLRRRSGPRRRDGIIAAALGRFAARCEIGAKSWSRLLCLPPPAPQVRLTSRPWG